MEVLHKLRPVWYRQLALSVPRALHVIPSPNPISKLSVYMDLDTFILTVYAVYRLRTSPNAHPRSTRKTGAAS
jgi:hypothetical protein